uniref:Uncharacterized protein n=1 Tax=Knipowitschia caucasica TaxID=637954 RepID=A0AAV2JIC1_KNICA
MNHHGNPLANLPPQTPPLPIPTPPTPSPYLTPAVIANCYIDGGLFLARCMGVDRIISPPSPAGASILYDVRVSVGAQRLLESKL